MTSSRKHWPENANHLACELHQELALNENNWHQLKGDADRRAAELLAGAMVQLLKGGEANEVEAMLNQAQRWLRRELKDPGCGKH